MKASTLSQASIYQDERYEIIDMSHIMPNKFVGEAILVTISEPRGDITADADIPAVRLAA
jgi:hypothetical protein